MPNAIGAAGLTTATHDELVAYWTGRFQAIYGADVNLDSDTPDGQLLGILVQACLDQEDWVANVNAMFDPDQAVGRILDMRVAMNGIQRQGGTYTVTPITLVVDRACTLTGLDALTGDPSAKVYTVSDEAGTQWKLQATQNFAAAGTYIVNFQAATPGKTLTTLNTITVPVSVVVGVTSINNPSTYSTLGQDQETDAELRLRRQRSVALAAQGVHDSLLAMLLNVPGVTYARVYENPTGVQSDGAAPAGVPAGIPRNSIWVVVDGSGAAAAIANAIYNKRNMGCGMKGAQQQVITQADGTKFYVYYDIVSPEVLYIQFNAQSIDEVTAVDAAYIAQQLALLFKPDVGQTVDVTSLGTIVQQIDPNCAISSAGFSTSGGGPFTATLAPAAANKRFTVSAVNISITVVG